MTNIFRSCIFTCFVFTSNIPCTLSIIESINSTLFLNSRTWTTCIVNTSTTICYAFCQKLFLTIRICCQCIWCIYTNFIFAFFLCSGPITILSCTINFTSFTYFTICTCLKINTTSTFISCTFIREYLTISMSVNTFFSKLTFLLSTFVILIIPITCNWSSLICHTSFLGSLIFTISSWFYTSSSRFSCAFFL